MQINIHTHNNLSAPEVVKVVSLYENFTNFSTVGFFSLGIHPWFINPCWQEDLSQILQGLTKEQVIALGEAGLDKIHGAPIKVQMEVYTKQAALSEQFNKPMIIHCVKAYSELLKIRQQLQSKQPWIFHGFSGNAQTAMLLLKNNCFISFGTKLISSPSLQKVFINIPISGVFFETDNLPDTYLSQIYAKAAQILNLELGLLEKQIETNFQHCFGFPPDRGQSRG